MTTTLPVGDKVIKWVTFMIILQSITHQNVVYAIFSRVYVKILKVLNHWQEELFLFFIPPAWVALSFIHVHMSVHLTFFFCSITSVPQKQIIWSFYSRSGTMKDRPSLISDLTSFSVQELCPRGTASMSYGHILLFYIFYLFHSEYQYFFNGCLIFNLVGMVSNLLVSVWFVNASELTAYMLNGKGFLKVYGM